MTRYSDEVSSAIRTVTVSTPNASYDVEIGKGLLASVGFRVDELHIGAGVDHAGDLEREQPAERRVGRRVGERERHPLVVKDPLATLPEPLPRAGVMIDFCRLNQGATS